MQTLIVFSYFTFPLSCPFLSLAFLPTLSLTFDFLFHILNGCNLELLHHLIQTLCHHLSRSTSLRKTRLTGHYLRFPLSTLLLEIERGQ